MPQTLTQLLAHAREALTSPSAPPVAIVAATVLVVLFIAIRGAVRGILK